MCHETMAHMCLPVSEKIIRTVAVYFFLVIGFRAATLLSANYVIVRLCYRYPTLDRLLEGNEVVLDDKGKINQKACQRELITEEELMTVARRQGARSLDEIERIVLERSGNVSVVVKEDATLKRILEEVPDLKRSMGR